MLTSMNLKFALELGVVIFVAVLLAGLVIRQLK